ncbi:MAG: deoxynucleoside kinase [Nanoarchaeota archaeon]|nr:deoxynucleoside kinase [Nanoarchaeota archaeon]
MHKILSIEGINGTGKTYFTKQFSQKYDFFIIKELADEEEKDEKYPTFKTDRYSIKKDINWFVEKELTRIKKSQQKLEKRSVIADRWITSIAAFSYARNQKYKTDENNLLLNALSKLDSEFTKIPWIVIISLKEPWIQHKKILLKRNNNQTNRNTSLTEPYDCEFYQYLSNYYERLAKKNPCDILTIDKNANKMYNYNKVFNWLETKTQPWSNMSIKDIIISGD